LNRWRALSALLFLLVFLNPGSFYARAQTLDSLRMVVQEIVADSSSLNTTTRRVLSAYLYQAKSRNSPEDIIYAYQQLAALNYSSGDINQALKFYKLYVLELEELTEFEEYKDQQFETNLYENEIRALKQQVGELEKEIAILEEEKAANYERNYFIFIGLRVIVGITLVLLIGWIYQRYRKAKTGNVIIAGPSENSKELTEVLTRTKNQLIVAETELTLADILVQREISSAEEYFTANKSLRRKFLISLPKGLTSGAGLYLQTTKNLTIIALFNSVSTGASGGLLAAQVYHQLDQIIRNLGLSSPSLILDQLEESIAKLFPAGIPFSGGIPCGIALYDKTAKTITYCGANLDLYEVNQGNLQVHSGSGNSLLINKGEEARHNIMVELGTGNNFYLATDTYWRQEGGHEFKPLGLESFEKTIVSVYKQPAEEQRLVLTKVYEEWLGGNDPIGDVLVFGFLV
jgi:predicted nuclease of restriction endonuclease-like (RecB) superfamily